MELQRCADETGLRITVCHFPPGTSKWNKIEHRLFSHITQNWRGRPLVSHEVVVNLIAATTTRTGLTVRAELDPREYPKGIKISDRQIRELESRAITRHDWHGEWNYTLTATSRNRIRLSGSISSCLFPRQLLRRRSRRHGLVAGA